MSENNKKPVAPHMALDLSKVLYGNSHIVDYYGNIMSYSASGCNTMAAAILDIEALRQFRVINLNSNWMKDLRTEVFRKMYELPIHPKNLWLDQDPPTARRGG